MRANVFWPILLVCAFTLHAAEPTIADVIARIDETDGNKVRLNVWRSGDWPADTVVDDPQYWRVSVAPPHPEAAPLVRIPIAAPVRDGEGIVFVIPRSQLPAGCEELEECRWVVAFDPPDALKPVVFDAKPPDKVGWGPLRPLNANEKKKPDPDIYLTGSHLASRGTKPIFAVEARIRYRPEAGGWRIGPTASIATAAIPKSDDPKLLPRDKIEIDPDSVKGGLSFHRTSPWQMRWLRVDIEPGGEFSRDLKTSNFVTAAWAELLVPAQYAGTLYLNLDFITRVEGGRNLNTPDTLLDQSVDLSWYRGIARVVPGAKTAFGSYAKGKHRWQVLAQHLTRLPLKDEPFVRYRRLERDPAAPELVKIEPRIEQTRKPRHLTTATVLVNFNDYWGFTAEYRYGSEPPLFRFVDHRVIIGLKFSAMFK
jgi:hypothetical protein